MPRPTRSDTVVFTAGLFIGIGVTAYSIGSTVQKMIAQNDAFKAREIAKLDRMLHDLTPYAPEAVLEKILVDFEFNSILTHEKLG